MDCKVRKRVDQDDPCDDQGQACDSRKVQPMPKDKDAGKCDHNDPQTRRQRVCDTQRHVFQRECQKVERTGKTRCDQKRRPEPGELRAGVQCGVPDRFGDDRGHEVYVMCRQSDLLGWDEMVPALQG